MWAIYLFLGLAVFAALFLLTYAIDVNGPGRGS